MSDFTKNFNRVIIYYPSSFFKTVKYISQINDPQKPVESFKTTSVLSVSEDKDSLILFFQTFGRRNQASVSVEEYDWKSLVQKKPLQRLTSNGASATLLKLTPG